jgi:L-asparaginase
MSEDILLYSLEKGAEGLVIEAFGVGNVSPRVLIGIKEAIRRDIPVVLVSRCPVGRIEHIYAYEGAGKQLYDEGVIFADFLNGQKARIKLIVALGANKNYTELKRSFEWASIKNTLR